MNDRRFRRLAAFVLALGGLLHAAANLLARRQPGRELAAVALSLQAARYEKFGLRRSLWDLFGGYSLALSLLLVTLAALVFLIDRGDPPLSARRLPWATAAAAVAALLILALAAIPAQLPVAALALALLLLGFPRNP